MSKKILVVDDESDIREIISMIIESSYEDIEIIEASSGNEAIEILKTTPEIALILCDYHMANGGGDTVYSFMRNGLIKTIPYILVSTDTPNMFDVFHSYKQDNILNSNLVKPFTEEELISNIDSILFAEGTANLIPDKETRTDGYRRIFVERVIKNLPEKLNYDLYLKLSDKKYVKLIASDMKVDVEDLLKYKMKGIDHLYLHQSDFLNYFESAFEKFKDILTNEHSSDQEVFQAQQFSVGHIHEYAQQIGINKMVVELTNNVIASVKQSLSKHQTLSDYINKMQSQGGYICAHAQLTAYIAVAMSEKVQWRTPNITEALAIAAIFQNIGLDGHEKAKVQSVASDDFARMPRDVRVEIIDHPKVAADKIKDITDFPLDTYNIILNHHELPDGTGFPKGDRAVNLTPVECIFIISQQFAHKAVLGGFNSKNVINIIQEMQSKFSVGSYKKPFESFLKLFH